MPSKIAILPWPLNPAALFGYGILRFLSQIDELTYIRFASASTSYLQLLKCEDKIADLRIKGDNLYLQVLKLAEASLKPKHVLSLESLGKNQEVYNELESVLRKLNIENSRLALSNFFELIIALIQNDYDPARFAEFVRAEIEELKPFAVDTPKRSYPPKRGYRLWQKFEKKSGQREAEKKPQYNEIFLEEGRVFSLQDRHISIVVGGPPRAGKSTVATMLVEQMRIVIKSLQTGSDFSSLKVTVHQPIVDRSTPTSRAIKNGEGQDREKLEQLKEPWNGKHARIARRALIESRARYNIVVADLPGLVTDITRMLVAPADAAIIISKDMDIVRQEWIPLMNEFGVPVFSRIHHVEIDPTTGKGLPSTATKWVKGELLNGRVLNLDRTLKPDPFIEDLTEFLLFDILPTQFGEKE